MAGIGIGSDGVSVAASPDRRQRGTTGQDPVERVAQLGDGGGRPITGDHMHTGEE
jgi:hypothetical protein